MKLTAAHDGLPAGTEIQIGFAQAAVQTAPPAPKTTTTATTTDRDDSDRRPSGPAAEDAPGDRRQRRR